MTQSNSMALPQVGMVFGVSADTGALRPLQSVAPANPARCFWNRSWARASVCTCCHGRLAGAAMHMDVQT